MFHYDFMQNAFAAGGIAAAISGVIGVFLVLRAQIFAGHALSHVGFAGATGALLVGVSPLWGLIALTLAAGLFMGMLGERLSGRDVAIGIVLSLSLGFGLLFLHFYTAYAAQATALLFGNVLGVDRPTVWLLAALAAVCFTGLAAIARPLLFATLQPEVAEARGVKLRLVATIFLGLTALAVSECAQIVGVLLVFTLMVGPAATAQLWTARLGQTLVLSVGLAMAEAWLGIALAYWTDWPASFWITTLSAGAYLASLGLTWLAGLAQPLATTGQ